MGCTEDSGPMKPGNSVEDKTLTTGKRREGRTAPRGVQFHLGRPGRPERVVWPWEVMDERRE